MRAAQKITYAPVMMEVKLTISLEVRLDIEGVENVAGLCQPTLGAAIIGAYPTPIFLRGASRIHTNVIITLTNRRAREWESAPNPTTIQN
jgi:hypothetical protein